MMMENTLFGNPYRQQAQAVIDDWQAGEWPTGRGEAGEGGRE